MAGREWFVVHLPVSARDLAGAIRLARVMGRSMRLVPLTDPGRMTVSHEDEQGVHHQVFCDRRLPGGDRRCALPTDRDGPCARRVRR